MLEPGWYTVQHLQYRRRQAGRVDVLVLWISNLTQGLACTPKKANSVYQKLEMLVTASPVHPGSVGPVAIQFVHSGHSTNTSIHSLIVAHLVPIVRSIFQEFHIIPASCSCLSSTSHCFLFVGFQIFRTSFAFNGSSRLKVSYKELHNAAGERRCTA